MIALLWTAGILTTVAAYLAIGLRWVAPRYVTRYLERDFREFAVLAKDPSYVERERRFAAGTALGIAFIWPAYLAMTAVTSALMRAAPLTDHELRQQLADRDRRIAELEREVGLR